MTDTQGLPWTDAFLLGYEPMDDTHREFVEIVESTAPNRGTHTGLSLWRISRTGPR